MASPSYLLADENIDTLGFHIEMERKNGDKERATGMRLTWEDLWVTVSDHDKEGKSKAILQGVTGYACPSQLLAIMGPSGCGKSTLLDALAGRLGSNTKQTGQILINGHKQDLAYGTSAYVIQDETLLATLTVQESVYYSSQLQLPETMSKSEKKKRGEDCIKEMGLQGAMETRVGGNWGVKGLSGGQKRRLSICIELLTRPKLVFLDEPTSGLDSAASLHVLTRIANTVRSDGRTVIASIHQPSKQVFDLFDNLCLLSSGSTVYFGPAAQANLFFASNGLPCPPLQNPSDHFLQMINKDFDDEDPELGLQRKSTEEIVHALLISYTSSDYHQQVRGVISTIYKEKGEKIKTMTPRHANLFTQCTVLTKRSFVNMHRDIGYYWLRLVIYTMLGLGLGTMFFQLGFTYDSIQARGAVIMFVSTFLTFMAIGGFPSFVEDMKVFKVERLNGHYETIAFVIANTFSSMPYLFLISIIPGAACYYLSGFQREFQHFVYFILLIFASMMLVESLMMIVASIVSNFLMGIIAGAGLQGFMCLGGGFFRLPNDLPPILWKYPLYYISFHKYAFQGLYKNEFQGLEFTNKEGTTNSSNKIYGSQILKDVWQVDISYSKWVDLAILFGMIILYRLLFLVIIKISEKMRHATISAFTKRPQRQIVIESSE